MPRHHPSDAVLACAAAGTLDICLAIVTQRHTAGCERCQETARLAEAMGGCFLARLPEAPLPEGLLEQTLARLDEDVAENEAVTLAGCEDAHPAEATPGFGCDVILRSADGVLCLVEMKRGSVLERHTHDGMELALVVLGEFQVEGETYRPGDLHEADSTLSRCVLATGMDRNLALVAIAGGGVDPDANCHQLIGRMVRAATPGAS